MNTCVDHLWIPMPDGARLGARLWLPEQTSTRPVPAILEYIPYRKDDYSAIRDSTTIAYFADHGYACIRVDMRGSGSSDGVLDDEYSNQEIDDGVSVIHWIAEQDWCDGNVGTIGISWGGITGLQLAQRAPVPLKTVIALGASEFRYYDDAGYYMGCMVGQTIGWAAIMFGYNTRPPDPALVGESWRDLWLDRLNNVPHYLEHFLSHQREDDYWLRGTVGTHYSSIKIPVYAA
ncbi:MAG: CocE/NonD family hydrolase, partial [Gammaproteobacteria bacterium]